MATIVAQQYNLGPVTPLVEQVASILGSLFGITTVHGYRAVGSVEDSDHPKGKALDFMVPSIAKGDALANFAAANAKILGIKYIVWNRRSWNPQRGTWVPYTSTNNPHTDHVHISFNDKNDGSPLDDFIRGLASGIPGGIQDIPNLVDPLGITRLSVFKPDFWRRIGTGVLGAGFIVAGLLFIARRPIGQVVSGVGGAVGSVAGTAIQGWSFGLGAGTTGAIGKAATASTPKPSGPKPPAIESPSNAPTTSALPPEIYAPVSAGGTYSVTAVGRAKNPTEYRRPDGGNLVDLAGQRNPAPTKRKGKSKKGSHGAGTVSAPMRQEPYGGK